MEAKKNLYFSPGHRHLPLMRFLARLTDYVILGLLFELVLITLISIGGNEIGLSSWLNFLVILDNSYVILGLALLVLWIPIEATLQFWLKTTPGKFLFQLKVQNIDGADLSFKKLLHRSVLVWAQGLWIGFFSFIPMIIQGRRLLKYPSTTYDNELGLIVVQKRMHPAIVAIVTLVISGLLVWWFSLGAIDSQNNTSFVEELLIETSAEVNKTLPSMVNDSIQLTSITSSGSDLIYHYNVVSGVLSKHDLDKSAAVSAACSDADTVSLLNLGVNVISNYYDLNDELIGGVSLSLSDCK